MVRCWNALLVGALLAAGCSEARGPRIEIVTNMGTIRAELFEDVAPITVKNVLRYVDEKHYDGTIFHRVIPDFMIQGGGFKPGMVELPSKHPPIKNESFNGVSNRRGTLAMARTNDPHSADCQFFINVKDNTFLDQAEAKDRWGYTVFGKVVEGMDVVDQIRKVRTSTKGAHEDVPINDVIIQSIRRLGS